MNLLAPWLLAGLAALAVPVLVHLIRRRDPRRIPFPSLMFLDGAPHEARGQRALR
ncbi:MAG: BatA domain-containing protein, partial [Gammaproteobacteria bacterium]